MSPDEQAYLRQLEDDGAKYRVTLASMEHVPGINKTRLRMSKSHFERSLELAKRVMEEKEE